MLVCSRHDKLVDEGCRCVRRSWALEKADTGLFSVSPSLTRYCTTAFSNVRVISLDVLSIHDDSSRNYCIKPRLHASCVLVSNPREMRVIHSGGKTSHRACLWLEGTRQVVPTRATQPSSQRFSPNKSHREMAYRCSMPCVSAASLPPARVWQTASSLWRSSKVQLRGQHTQATATAAEAHPR